MKKKQGSASPATRKGLFSNFSLTFRLSLGITLLITVLLGAVGFGTYMRDRNVFMEEAVNRGWTTVHTVQTFAGDHLARGNQDHLHNLLVTLEKDPLIAKAFILDNQGQVIIEKTPGLVGQAINDANALQAVETRTENMGILRDERGKNSAITFTAPLVDLGAQNRGYLYLAVDLGWVNAHLQETIQSLLVNFILAVLAGLFLTRLIVLRYVQRPVQALVEATEKVSTGDFSGKLPVTTRDELGKLARAFNTMNTHLAVLFLNVRATVQDMNNASSSIVKHTQRMQAEEENEDGTQLQEEVIREINTSAKKLTRMSDKLQSLALQFKTDTKENAMKV